MMVKKKSASKSVLSKRVKEKGKEGPEGIFVPAGALLGLGLGGAFDSWAEGVLIGLGLGFFAMAMTRLIKGS